MKNKDQRKQKAFARKRVYTENKANVQRKSKKRLKCIRKKRQISLVWKQSF